MDPDHVLDVLHDAASAVTASLGDLDDWSLTGGRAGEYHSDLVADLAATTVLEAAGLGWLSEESGRQHPDRAITVVLDPLDGSTNAHRGLPWYATSLCAVGADGPLTALVADLAHGRRFSAVRGAGARLDGVRIEPSGCERLDDAFVTLSGHPTEHLGWYQYRALGAVALDLCAVAAGWVDASIDCSPNAHGPWDYLGGMLVCHEAGALAVDAFDRDLVALEHHDRRTPVAASTGALLDEAIRARRAVTGPDDPSLGGAGDSLG